jgi:adenylate cyclase
MAFAGDRSVPSSTRPWREDLAARRSVRVATAFANEERRGRRLATGVRFAASAAIVVWVLYQNPSASGGYFAALAACFAVLGYIQLWLSERGIRGPLAIGFFVVLDAALLAYTLVVPSPFASEPIPPGLPLRLHNFVYFFLLLALNTLCFARGLVLATGVAGGVAWGVAVGWVLVQTGKASTISLSSTAWLTPTGVVVRLGDPNYVLIAGHATEIVVLLLTAVVLEVAVHRARRLVAAQAESERARGNLARYFSPNVVDELASMEAPLGPGRVQTVAVLFADIVGFTAASEHQPPQETIALLRELHHRMADAVFDHGGTLDKYIGDAVMATFGTPRPGTDDAARALACARDLARQVDELAAAKLERGAPPVAVGIGVHYGEVVAGDVGDERRLEFTVIGDAVNVASRLERLTRELDLTIIASDDLLRAAGGPPADFIDFGELRLPGREAPIRLWGWHANAPSRSAPRAAGRPPAPP